MLLGMAASSHAAVITWQTPTTISGNTDVSTTGTLDRAYNMTNQSGSGAGVNGVSFLAFNVTSNTTTSATVGNTTVAASSGNLFSTLANGSSPSAAPFSSLSSAYGTILGQAVRINVDMTLTLNSLTVGQTYQLQIWTNKSTANSYAFTATAGNSVALDSNTTNVNGGVGQFVLGSFTANAVSQAVTFTPNSGAFVEFSAFQLRAIPEPSSIALLTLGGAGLLFASRRRMQNRA